MTGLPDRLTRALADRYRLERELGAGGMATVYLAQDLKHDRKVALKVLKPELAAVLGAERFVVEIRTTAGLQHPHILPLFDSGTADGFLYYVMPYVEGETLRTRLDRETQLGIDEAVRIAREVADALDYAHRHGVIHRDIKPENILLHDGRPMVADFGIALALSAAAGGRLTETGLSLGTPHYMSPEQATADKEITGRSDIYSLGTVLYEMLAGEPPHVGHSAQQIIMKIIAEEVEPVTQHRKAVPANVAAAVARALEKLPADRFATAKEFADALADPGYATLGGRTGHHAAPPRRRLAAVLPWAVAAVLAIVGAWGWFRAAPPAPVIRYSMGFAPGQGIQSGSAGINIAISPDGRRIVYVGGGAQAGQLWLRERDQLEAQPIPGTAGAFNPYFSPDGRQIAFSVGAAAALTIVPVAGGPPNTIDPGAIGSSGGGAWGPGGWIYFDTPRGTSRIRQEGGTPELLIPYDSATHEVGFAWTDALPDGKGLVFRVRRNLNPTDFDIDAFDLATRTRHFLIKGLLARYVAPGYLVVLRADGAVLAAPFDQDKLRLTGPAIPLFSGVMVKPLGSADLAISATGTLMYVPGSGSMSGYAEVVKVDPAGKMTQFDPPLTYNPASTRGFSLSPDGRRLAFDALGASSPDIWVKQLPNGPLTRLTFDSAGSIRPVWSSDGRHVYYISLSGTTHNSAVWRRRADGSAPPELVWQDPHEPVFSVSTSRDGSWLVYDLQRPSQGRDIYAIHLGHDTVPIPLLTTPARETSPTLSPDGRWLAYASDESGRGEIYVRPFPKINDGRWQISTDGGAAPSWSADGREIFFQDSAADLLAATVTPGPMFRPGVPRVVVANTFGAGPSLEVPFYAVTSDRRSFLMVRLATPSTAPGQGALTVVEGWKSELIARMRAAR